MSNGPGGDAASGQRAALVTGLSGAGKTTVLQVLEDLGWETVDNFPVRMISRFLAGQSASDAPVALGFDARTRGFEPKDMVRLIARLSEDRKVALTSVFLDCATDELERRYNETRRLHPLARQRPVRIAIEEERRWLDPLRRQAQWVLDTTSFTRVELQQRIRGHFGNETGGQMQINIASFGFARGMPPLADLVFDMRFLANPHWDDGLRPLTGLDEQVSQYVRADEAFATAMDRIIGLIEMLIPRYQAQGRSYLNIAFGCTGGRHRSVVCAEHLADHLRSSGFSPTVLHRNLPPFPEGKNMRDGLTEGVEAH